MARTTTRAWTLTMVGDKVTVPECPHLSSTGVVMASGRIIRTRPDFQSRPKPDNLLLAMTAYGPGTYEIILPGECRKVESLKVWCATKQKYVAGLAERARYIGVVSAFNEIDPPPWQNAMREEITSQRQNLASDIAEWRQTRDLFSQGAEKIVKYDDFRAEYKNARSRRQRRSIVTKYLKWFGQATDSVYAAFKLGIEPTVRTLQDLRENIGGKIAGGERTYILCKSSSRNERESVVTGANGQSRTLVRKGVEASIVLQHSWDLNKVWAGYAENALWETIPYSWVVDYFVGVGDWLTRMQALTPGQSSVVAGCIVNRRTVRTISDLKPVGYSSVRPSVYYRQDWSRVIVDTIPLPTLEFLPYAKSETWAKRFQLLKSIMFAKTGR